MPLNVITAAVAAAAAVATASPPPATHVPVQHVNMPSRPLEQFWENNDCIHLILSEFRIFEQSEQGKRLGLAQNSDFQAVQRLS